MHVGMRRVLARGGRALRPPAAQCAPDPDWHHETPTNLGLGWSLEGWVRTRARATTTHYSM